MYNPIMTCLSKFSPTDTLLVVAHQVEAGKLFPQGWQRFTS